MLEMNDKFRPDPADGESMFFAWNIFERTRPTSRQTDTIHCTQ